MSNIIKINDVDVSFEVQDGQVFATSLSVSEVFNIEHKNILRKIDQMEAETRGRLKIVPSYYINQQNKKQPMFELNRDAFSFIVMSLTGKEAEKWKLDFIDGFNAMERHIRMMQERPVHVINRKEAIRNLASAEVGRLECEIKELQCKMTKAYEEIQIYKKILYTPPTPWSEEDIDRLLDMREAGRSFGEIGRMLGRSRNSVEKKYYKLAKVIA